MTTTITVTCCIVSPRNVDLSKLAIFLEIQPTKIWKQDRVRTDNPALNFQEWQYEVENFPAGDFDTAIQHVIQPFWRKRTALLEFCARTDSHVTVHLQPHADASAIVFAIDNPDTIKKLADLSARLHFHFEHTN